MNHCILFVRHIFAIVRMLMQGRRHAYNRASVVIVAILFTVWGSDRASIRVQGQSEASATITIISEDRSSMRSYTISGDALSEPFFVQDGERITILVRAACGEVIASGIFEVDVSLCKLGAVLSAHVRRNLLLDQCEEALIERACAKALARVGL